MTNLSERQQLGRAKNAVSEYITRKLSVPKIFVDAEWNGLSFEVLAMDRAGVGDVHVFRMITRNPSLGAGESVDTIIRTIACLDPMHAVPSQYRYVAIVSSLSTRLEFEPSADAKQKTFAEDGLGRIGLLYVDVSRDEPTVNEMVRAERFRSTQKIVEMADQYVTTHMPNMEFRDPLDFPVHA